MFFVWFLSLFVVDWLVANQSSSGSGNCGIQSKNGCFALIEAAKRMDVQPIGFGCSEFDDQPLILMQLWAFQKVHCIGIAICNFRSLRF